MAEDGSAREPGKRRGRPPGSVSLTQEIQDTIVAYIRAGAFPHAATQAAGISTRTFHDWMARGEGRHPDRPCTPKLKAFATAVRRAQAEARVAQEVRIYTEQPKFWLTHAARSRPEDEGWTKPVEEPEEPTEQGSWLDRMLQELREKQARERIDHEERCSDPECKAREHRRRNGTHEGNPIR